MSSVNSVVMSLTDEKDEERMWTVNVGMRVNASHVAMLDASANHYGVKRSALARDLVIAAIEDMFQALPESDREQVAKEADNLFNEWAQEHFTKWETTGMGSWQFWSKVLQDPDYANRGDKA